MITKISKYGFVMGPVEVERSMSDDKKGWAILMLKTQKISLQVYVTKTGKVRIYTYDTKKTNLPTGEWTRPKKKA